MPRRCPACNALLSSMDKYCPSCGKHLTPFNKNAKAKPRRDSTRIRFNKDTNDKSSDKRSTEDDDIKYRSTTHHYPPNQYPYYPYPYYPPYPGVYYQPPRRPSDIIRILAAIPVIPSYIFLGIILFINIVMLLIGLGIVTPNLSMGMATIALIYPWPNFLYLVNLSGVTLIGWYFFIVAAIIISVIWLIKTEGREFISIFSKSAKRFRPPPSDSENSFIMISQLFFALIFFNIIVIILVLFLGMPETSQVAEEEPVMWEYFFDLANASVAEEIFTRIVYIGLPLLAFDLIVRKRTEKIHRYFLGGNFKLEHITIFLIIISSILFGLAHYPSWGLWKVAPTFVAGLAFGYLFIRKGLHTAIILHFLFDYMSLALLFFSGSIVILFILSLILLFVILFWTFSGIIYFSVYLVRIFDFFSLRLFGKVQDGVPVAASGGSKARTETSTAPSKEDINRGPSWHSDQPYYPYGYGYPMYYYSPQDQFQKPTKTAPEPSRKGRRCSRCKNNLIFVPYVGRYYCEHCLKYE